MKIPKLLSQADLTRLSDPAIREKAPFSELYDLYYTTSQRDRNLSVLEEIESRLLYASQMEPFFKESDLERRRVGILSVIKTMEQQRSLMASRTTSLLT